jgi:hypothetical protein
MNRQLHAAALSIYSPQARTVTPLVACATAARRDAAVQSTLVEISLHFILQPDGEYAGHDQRYPMPVT